MTGGMGGMKLVRRYHCEEAPLASDHKRKRRQWRRLMYSRGGTRTPDPLINSQLL